jgi:hypothetical protein
MVPTPVHCEFGVAVSCCTFFFVLFGQGFAEQFNTTATLVLDFCET